MRVWTYTSSLLGQSHKFRDAGQDLRFVLPFRNRLLDEMPDAAGQIDESLFLFARQKARRRARNEHTGSQAHDENDNTADE